MDEAGGNADEKREKEKRKEGGGSKVFGGWHICDRVGVYQHRCSEAAGCERCCDAASANACPILKS